MNNFSFFRSFLFVVLFSFCFIANVHAVNVDNYNDFVTEVTSAPSGVTTELIVSTEAIVSSSTSPFSAVTGSILDIKSGTAGTIAFLDTFPTFNTNGAAINFTDIGLRNSTSSALKVQGSSNVSFTGIVSIASNTAAEGAGISVSGSTVSFTSATGDLSFNTADYGGALLSELGAEINFDDSTIYFTSNKATASGGAIYADTNSKLNSNSSNLYFNNNTANYGAAVYLSNTSFSFNNSLLSAENNRTTFDGGAFFLGTTSSFEMNSSTANFSSNNARYGGAVYLKDQSEMSFTNSTVFFTSNTALQGGSFYLTGSHLNFTGGSSVFSNNSAVYIGGAINVFSNSSLTFTDTKADFIGNSAIDTGSYGDGGAINSSQSTTKFINSEMNFMGNKASRAGGAITVYGYYGVDGTFSAENSILTFINNETGESAGTKFAYGGAVAALGNGHIKLSSSSVLFSNNKALSKGYGGGLYYNIDATLLVENTTMQFSGNSANIGGGAIGSVVRTSATFNNSDVTFTGNDAQYGGALYLSSFNHETNAREGSTYLEFDEMSSAIFDGNIAYSNGGAVFLDDSSAVFAGASTFTNNTSSAAGGAFYMENGSSLEFTDTASAVFSTNNADKGGAVYLSGNSNAKITNALFSGNTASSLGGAIYTGGTSATQRAVLEVGASSGITTTFTGNTANGVSNAIYVDNHSDIIFNISDGGIVDMSDNITANTVNDSVMYYKGAGDFNLNALADTEYLDYELSENVKFNLGLNGQLKAKDFEMKDNAILNMYNGSADTLEVDSFSMAAGNTLNMDLVNNTPTNDTIMAQNAVNLDGTLNLYIGVGDYTNLHINLINSATDQLSGAFSQVNLISLGGGTLTPDAGRWHQDYDQDWFKIVTYLRNPSNFANLRPLSHNQKEVAKSIDKISGSLNPYGEMAVLVNNMLSSSVANQKSALSQMSGDFIANAMLSGVSREHRDTLSVRMNPRYCPQDDTKLSKSIWGQAKGRLETLKETENSIGDFHNNIWGIQAGVDVYSSDKVITGLFIGYNDHSLEQGNSEGDIDKYELGAYSGFSGEHWELSGILSLGYGQFDTRRKIEFANRTAKAEFNGYSVAADIEAGYKINLSETINLKPFAGVTFGLGITESFKEKGASVLNLHADEATQIKTDALIGLSLEREKNRFTWNAGIYGKYVVLGEQGEFDAVMEGTKEKMEIWGAEQGRISANITAGLEYALTKKWSLYANANAGIAEDYENYQGIAGVNYKFCGKKKDQKPAKQQDEVTEVKEEILTAAEEEQLENEAKEKAAAEEERLKKENEEKAAAEKAAEEERLRKEAEAAALAKAFASKQEVEVAKIEIGKVTNVSGANFLVGKATLGPKTQESIKQSAEELKDKEFEKIIVTGHTDSTGSKALNDKLSLQRAEAVANIFTDNGIAKEKVSTVGKGSSEPIASNATPEGRSENRRVEIEVK